MVMVTELDNAAFKKLTTTDSKLVKKRDSQVVKRMGTVDLYQSKSNQLRVENFMVLNVKSQNQQQQNSLISTVKKRSQQLGSKLNVGKVLAYHKNNQSNMCGSVFSLDLVLEYHNLNLLKVIQNNQKTNQKFPEPELWFILEQSNEFLSDLQNSGSSHGDVHPEQIFVTDEKSIQLYDQSILNNGQPPLVNAQSQIKNKYLAPEQLKLLKAKNLKGHYDENKADVYSLGMTMLHAASLQPSNRFYDYPNHQVNDGKVKQALNQLGHDGMSQSFVNVLTNMLQENPAQRFSPREVSQAAAQIKSQPVAKAQPTNNANNNQQVHHPPRQSVENHQQVNHNPAPVNNNQWNNPAPVNNNQWNNPAPVNNNQWHSNQQNHPPVQNNSQLVNNQPVHRPSIQQSSYAKKLPVEQDPSLPHNNVTPQPIIDHQPSYVQPTVQPTIQPTIQPIVQPTIQPTIQPVQQYVPPQQTYVPPQQTYVPPQQTYVPPQQTYVQPTVVSRQSYVQPTISQPTISQPTISQPTISQPTISQPSVQRPSYVQPTIPQSTYVQPTIAQSTYVQPSINQTPSRPSIVPSSYATPSSTNIPTRSSQAGHITAEQLEEMIRTGKVIRTADGKLVMT